MCLTKKVGDMPSSQNSIRNVKRPLSCTGHTHRDYLLVFNAQSSGTVTSRQTRLEHCSDLKEDHPYSSYTQLPGISFVSFTVLESISCRIDGTEVHNERRYNDSNTESKDRIVLTWCSNSIPREREKICKLRGIPISSQLDFCLKTV